MGYCSVGLQSRFSRRLAGVSDIELHAFRFSAVSRLAAVNEARSGLARPVAGGLKIEWRIELAGSPRACPSHARGLPMNRDIPTCRRRAQCSSRFTDTCRHQVRTASSLLVVGCVYRLFLALEGKLPGGADRTPHVEFAREEIGARRMLSPTRAKELSGEALFIRPRERARSQANMAKRHDRLQGRAASK